MLTPKFVAHGMTRLDDASDLVAAAQKAGQTPLTILVNKAGTHLKMYAADTTPLPVDGGAAVGC